MVCVVFQLSFPVLLSWTDVVSYLSVGFYFNNRNAVIYKVLLPTRINWFMSRRIYIQVIDPVVCCQTRRESMCFVPSAALTRRISSDMSQLCTYFNICSHRNRNERNIACAIPFDFNQYACARAILTLYSSAIIRELFALCLIDNLTFFGFYHKYCAVSSNRTEQEWGFIWL